MNALPRNLLGLPHDQMVRAVQSRATYGRSRFLKASARALIAEPARIAVSMRPDFYGPVPTSVAARIRHCSAALASEIDRGRRRHFSYSRCRLDGLREAMLALRWQRRFTLIQVVSIDEAEAA